MCNPLFLNGWRCRLLLDANWPMNGEITFPVTVTSVELAALPEWDTAAMAEVERLLRFPFVILEQANPEDAGVGRGGYWVTATKREPADHSAGAVHTNGSPAKISFARSG